MDCLSCMRRNSSVSFLHAMSVYKHMYTKNIAYPSPTFKSSSSPIPIPISLSPKFVLSRPRGDLPNRRAPESSSVIPLKSLILILPKLGLEKRLSLSCIALLPYSIDLSVKLSSPSLSPFRIGLVASSSANTDGVGAGPTFESSSSGEDSGRDRRGLGRSSSTSSSLKLSDVGGTEGVVNRFSLSASGVLCGNDASLNRDFGGGFDASTKHAQSACSKSSDASTAPTSR